jgi:hypothetical protein
MKKGAARNVLGMYRPETDEINRVPTPVHLALLLPDLLKNASLFSPFAYCLLPFYSLT